MNIKKYLEVLITGKAAGLVAFPEEKITSISDVRLTPFSDLVVDKTNPFAEPLLISRLFGPSVLVKSQDLKESELNTINFWLAILDHYGVDAEYTQGFFDVMKNALILIAAYGYINDGDDPNTAIRKFNGRELTREEFYSEFFRLVVRYVPSKEVKGDSPFTTWAK